MKKILAIAVIYAALQPLQLAAAVAHPDIDNYDNPDSVAVSISQVPQAIMASATKAKPGVYLSRVVRNLEADDEYYYNFEGSTAGKYWIIVVRADGTLIKVREETDRPRSRSD